jgi:hypothetical protein
VTPSGDIHRPSRAASAGITATAPLISLLSRVSDSYRPGPSAVQAARGLTVYACRTWHLAGPVARVAELVTAELVGNAVRHARTRVHVTVTRSPHRVHIAVRDFVSAPARLSRPAGEPGEISGGRGLLIVDALATHWGCTPVDTPAGPGTGKITWAALATG